MTDEEYDYRVRISRLFIPLGMAVYGYYFIHSLSRNTYLFTIIAALGFLVLSFTFILLIRRKTPGVDRHIHRYFPIYARTVLTILGLSQFLAITTYTRLEYVPWTFIFPLMAIVLCGNREALFWVILHVIVMTPCIFGIWPGNRPEDSISTGMTTLVAYFTVYLCSAVIEAARTRTLETTLKQKRQLVESLDKLDTARLLAENANEAKSRFLANVSHELRTPLNHIIGFTELVADGKFGRMNQAQEDYLRNALSSSGHLLALIDDILDLSTIETGRKELHISRIHTESLVKESVLVVSEIATANKVHISVKIENPPAIIHADRRMMNQVMYNLLSNAIKFSPGGLVTVRASGRPPDKTENTHEADLEISISDTGTGIDPAYLDRIFQPFERINDTENRQTRGTGLGLSVSKEIVALHHGSLTAQSEGKGKGCIFTLIIPTVNANFEGIKSPPSSDT